MGLAAWKIPEGRPEAKRCGCARGPERGRGGDSKMDPSRGDAGSAADAVVLLQVCRASWPWACTGRGDVAHASLALCDDGKMDELSNGSGETSLPGLLDLFWVL